MKIVIDLEPNTVRMKLMNSVPNPGAPVGNPGGANVPALQSMVIPEDLCSIINEHKVL